MWPLSSDECYVSADVEVDGPIPGAYSLLSLGAAAFDSEGDRVFARANREAGHSRARAILAFGRIPGRSAGCQGGKAGEAEFRFWLKSIRGMSLAVAITDSRAVRYGSRGVMIASPFNLISLTR